MQVVPDEIDKIRDGFNAPAQLRQQKTSIFFLDIKYRVVRADAMSIYAKNVRLVIQDSTRSGLVIAKTNEHYILASYDGHMFGSVAAEAVEKLADYFRNKEK